MEIGWLIGAVVLGLITGAIANNKGHSFFLWFVGGTLLAIVFLPVACFLKPTEKIADLRATHRGERKCPFCAEFVRPEATVCRHCQRDLPALP